MITQDNALRTLIRARLEAKRERERQQLDLVCDNEIFREVIRAKLDGINSSNQFYNFCRCGAEDLYRTCRECGSVEKFPYRCNLKWCPSCQWKLTEQRKEVLRLWAGKVKQPKHLVLTQKNFPILTRSKIRKHRQACAALRRRKIFREVKGGCISTEITNEGEGWHLHSHWLIDVRWLDMSRISKVWGSLVGQEFSICKIKDVRNIEYVQEVAKYVCEAAEMAKWPRELIHEFVTAVRGCRFFSAFGALREMAPQIRAELKSKEAHSKVCDCGCSEFIYEDELQTTLNAIRSMERKRRR